MKDLTAHTLATRLVVLDVETTGLSPDNGDRIVEFGGVELIDGNVGQKVQFYVNPERDIPQEAINVHGLTREFLLDKPVFADIAPQLYEFLAGGHLLAHNAEFDLRFLNFEFHRVGGYEPLTIYTDTLELAFERFGQRLSLDRLCDLLHVNRSARTLHGALLDAELLKDVYLRLIGGQSTMEGLDHTPSRASARVAGKREAWPSLLPVVAPTELEIEAHDAIMRKIQK
jgi:DNA polymerase-3 subunit epsilon